MFSFPFGRLCSGVLGPIFLVLWIIRFMFYRKTFTVWTGLNTLVKKGSAFSNIGKPIHLPSTCWSTLLFLNCIRNIYCCSDPLSGSGASCLLRLVLAINTFAYLKCTLTVLILDRHTYCSTIYKSQLDSLVWHQNWRDYWLDFIQRLQPEVLRRLCANWHHS